MIMDGKWILMARIMYIILIEYLFICLYLTWLLNSEKKCLLTTQLEHINTVQASQCYTESVVNTKTKLKKNKPTNKCKLIEILYIFNIYNFIILITDHRAHCIPSLWIQFCRSRSHLVYAVFFSVRSHWNCLPCRIIVPMPMFNERTRWKEMDSKSTKKV